MSTSIPLRGTSRLRLTTSGPSTGSPKRRRAACALGVVERTEPLRVDAGRHEHARQRPAGGSLALGERVAAGGDHEAGAAEHVAQHEVRAGQPAGHRDLGAVEHDGVRVPEPWADQTDRQGGIEHHQRRADLVGQVVDAAGERRRREEHLLLGPHDPVGLRRIPGRVALVRAW